jgi:hypothetical protein
MAPYLLATTSAQATVPSVCAIEVVYILQENIAYPVNLSPLCSDFANSGATTHFTWAELNGRGPASNPPYGNLHWDNGQWGYREAESQDGAGGGPSGLRIFDGDHRRISVPARKQCGGRALQQRAHARDCGRLPLRAGKLGLGGMYRPAGERDGFRSSCCYRMP